MDTRYDEALERARAGMPIDEVFPELKEIEDERIRKMLIEQMERWKKMAEDNNVEQDVKDASAAIAYLERQKEHFRDDTKMVEQNPAEWSCEDKKELDCIINILDRLGYEEFCKSSRDQDIEEERLYYEEIQFLKRLKSLRPQPHWTPKGQQLDCLRHMINVLMIGDWVRVPRLNKNGKVYRIDRANGVGNGFIAVLRGDFHEDDIEPVLLTPEILKKNGFENDFYEEESIADYHTIRLEGYSLKHNIGEIDGYLVTWCNGSINVTTDVHCCVQKDISYVHELQHALRLCGIEKEIEL